MESVFDSDRGRFDTSVRWLALGLLVFGILGLGRLTQTSVGHDFYQFWSFGRHIARDDGRALYTREVSTEVALAAAREVASSGSQRGSRAAQLNEQLYAEGVDPISTPWYYATFAVLTSGDYDTDLLVFQYASTLLFGLAGLLLCRALGFGVPGTLLVLASVLLAYGPLHADIQTGNTNRLQLAGLAIGLATAHRWPNRAGIATGTAILILTVAWKPNLAGVPLLLAVIWWIDGRRDWLLGAAMGLLAGSGLALAASVLSLGSLGAWSEWLAALSAYQSTPAPIERTNWSTARLLYEWLGTDTSLALTVALIASFGACAFRSRTSRTDDAASLRRDLSATCAGALLPLIGSMLAWDHYFLLAVPAMLLLLRPNAKAPVIPLLALLALWTCARAPLEMIFPSPAPIAIASSFAVATATLWGLLLYDLAVPARSRSG